MLDQSGILVMQDSQYQTKAKLCESPSLFNHRSVYLYQRLPTEQFELTHKKIQPISLVGELAKESSIQQLTNPKVGTQTTQKADQSLDDDLCNYTEAIANPKNAKLVSTSIQVATTPSQDLLEISNG